MGKIIETRLAELGITLPLAVAALNSYQHVVLANGFAFVAGQAPLLGGERPFMGRVGNELTFEQGQAAVRLSGLNVIAQMKLALSGDLDRIIRCVKLGIFVNSAPDFQDQPRMANPVSDMMVNIFGENGRHTRFAVGTIGPMNFACSVEAIFQVRE